MAYREKVLFVAIFVSSVQEIEIFTSSTWLRCGEMIDIETNKFASILMNKDGKVPITYAMLNHL